jgi:hypothetical protein
MIKQPKPSKNACQGIRAALQSVAEGSERLGFVPRSRHDFRFFYALFSLFSLGIEEDSNGSAHRRNDSGKAHDALSLVE